MALDHHHIMGICLAESNKAHTEGNVPVGSIVVRDGKVVGVGRNTVNSTTDPTAHAEVVAIRDACLKLGTIDLSGSTFMKSRFWRTTAGRSTLIRPVRYIAASPPARTPASPPANGRLTTSH